MTDPKYFTKLVKSNSKLSVRNVFDSLWPIAVGPADAVKKQVSNP